jgi:hypothetical protein
MKRARMLRDYRTQYHDPIGFIAGEVLVLGRRDTEWPEFIWATDPRGRSGWTPMSVIDMHASPVVARSDYSARELDAAEGETLELLRETGGWWWSQNSAGDQGWVPERDMHMIEETT